MKKIVKEVSACYVQMKCSTRATTGALQFTENVVGVHTFTGLVN